MFKRKGGSDVEVSGLYLFGNPFFFLKTTFIILYIWNKTMDPSDGE